MLLNCAPYVQAGPRKKIASDRAVKVLAMMSEDGVTATCLARTGCRAAQPRSALSVVTGRMHRHFTLRVAVPQGGRHCVGSMEAPSYVCARAGMAGGEAGTERRPSASRAPGASRSPGARRCARHAVSVSRARRTCRRQARRAIRNGPECPCAWTASAVGVRAAELFVLVVSKDTIARGSQAPYPWPHRCSPAVIAALQPARCSGARGEAPGGAGLIGY